MSPDVVDRADTGMAQSRSGASFELETLECGRIALSFDACLRELGAGSNGRVPPSLTKLAG